MAGKAVTSKDCRACKNWHDCVGKDWYHWGEIRWCVWQVLWILNNAESLKAGSWPSEGCETGYTDLPINKRIAKTEAYYVKPTSIIAELEYRLQKTYTNGKLLKAQIRAGDTIKQLEPEAYTALMYVKGWRQKRQSYSAWKKQRKYYQKVSSRAT